VLGAYNIYSPESFFFDEDETRLLDELASAISYALESLEHEQNHRQVGEALRESEERFRRALENIPDVVVIYDPDLRIRYINAATRQITGRPASSFIGKREEEIWPPEVYQTYLPTLREAFDTRTTRSLETDLLLPDGGLRSLRITCVPLIDEKANVREVLGITHDFTERKRAEEEIRNTNEELRAINRVVTVCTHVLSLTKILDRVLDEALSIVGLEGGTICLLEPDETLALAAHRAASEATVLDLTTNQVKVGECLCGACARDLKPLILPDREAVLKFSTREATRGEDIRFHAAFPLITGGKCLGVLCVFTRSDKKPEERRLKLLETVTSQIALAVGNASLFEETSRNAAILEDRVQERTAELGKKIADIERLNRLFVGRELKMIELKEKLKEMEGNRGRREGKGENADGS
jgi:PAS domain S-box-containing protein